MPQNDFLQGDFYGDSLQGSFVRKLLEELTPNRPFGYETSFSVELRDHTAMKSEALLEAKASAAIADAAAFIFIDAIDPVGTLNPLVYERMGRIFDRLMPYYPAPGRRARRRRGDLLQPGVEVQLRHQRPRRRHARPDRRAYGQLDASRPPADRTRTCRFGVLTKKSLAKLSQMKLLILSGVNMMDEEEVAAIRDWVRAGGTLLASGPTSLVDKTRQAARRFHAGRRAGRLAGESRLAGSRALRRSNRGGGRTLRQL